LISLGMECKGHMLHGVVVLPALLKL